MHVFTFNALLRVFFSTFSLCLFSFGGYAVAVTADDVVVFIVGAAVVVVVTHTHSRRVETHPTTLRVSSDFCFIPTNIRFSIFVGRNRPIVKSPSLNIERSDVTDNVNQLQGGTDQQLLNHIEQLILNDESKCF